jgi:hypothetical protein
MSNPDQLQTIDLAALAQVSGGAVAAPATGGNDEILTALSGILQSIQSIAGQQSNGGGFNQQEMLMMMMIMQRNQQQAPVTVASPPWQADPIIRYY